MPKATTTHIACRPHDHNNCIETALSQARQTCLASGARLTAIRERVLQLIWQSHKPLGAYDIIAMLSDQQKVVAPPTVYRALEFLLDQGLVHRIASLNAFVGCSLHNREHISQFLLCRGCGIAIEMDSRAINQAIQQNADTYGFVVDKETIEVSGLCQRCQE